MHSLADDSCPARGKIVGCREFDSIGLLFFVVADLGPPILLCQVEFVMYRNRGDPKNGVQRCSLDP